MKFKQSRNWCFTIFAKGKKTTIDYYNEIVDITNKYKDIIRYICAGIEECPKTKKLHIQGWIQFINKKTLGGVKRIIGINHIHLENCRGNEFDNDKYCKKDNNYFNYGKFISQGQRTDLENIKKKLDEGEKLVNIANDYFSDFIRYHKGFEK